MALKNFNCLLFSFFLIIILQISIALFLTGYDENFTTVFLISCVFFLLYAIGQDIENIITFILYILLVVFFMSLAIYCFIKILTVSPPILVSPLAVSYKYSIFFIESNYSRTEFSTKQLCAIESAAKNNPNSLIQIYLYKPEFNDRHVNFLFSDYRNIKMVNFDGKVLFNNTPLMAWWKAETAMRSRYYYAHVADAARIAFMWKYGGVYSDLDTITLKSFEPLLASKKNGFGSLYEGYPSLGSGVMVFSQSNHPFLKYVMQRFTQEYNPYDWSKNGPKLLKESIKTYCAIDDFLHLIPDSPNRTNLSDSCLDLTIFPERYFYPFTFARDQPESMFIKDFVNISEYKTRIDNETYSIHFYGHLSSKFQTSINDNSFYTQIAYDNCRRTFNYVKKNNLVFY